MLVYSRCRSCRARSHSPAYQRVVTGYTCLHSSGSRYRRARQPPSCRAAVHYHAATADAHTTCSGNTFRLNPGTGNHNLLELQHIAARIDGRPRADISRPRKHGRRYAQDHDDRHKHRGLDSQHIDSGHRCRRRRGAAFPWLLPAPARHRRCERTPRNMARRDLLQRHAHADFRLRTSHVARCIFRLPAAVERFGMGACDCTRAQQHHVCRHCLAPGAPGRHRRCQPGTHTLGLPPHNPQSPPHRRHPLPHLQHSKNPQNRKIAKKYLSIILLFKFDYLIL